MPARRGSRYSLRYTFNASRVEWNKQRPETKPVSEKANLHGTPSTATWTRTVDCSKCNPVRVSVSCGVDLR